jgi:putative intracellular protease/amidase
MAAKILIVTGDAAESLEVLYPYQRLREEGYEVHIAAPSRKKLQFVVHDFEDGFDTYTEKPGYTWPADLAFSEVDPGDYAALVIPGGPRSICATTLSCGRCSRRSSTRTSRSRRSAMDRCSRRPSTRFGDGG